MELNMNVSDVKHVYGKGASKYEQIMARYWEFDRQGLVDSLALREGERVLEIGVGTGKNLPFYPKGVEIVGIDFTAEMLEVARSKQEGLSDMDITLLEMDAENMRFPENHFDHILESFVLCVVPDPEKVLRELVRVSKSGAKIAVFDYCRSTRPEMQKWQELISEQARTVGFPRDVIVWDPLRDYEEIIARAKLPLRIEHIERHESDNPFLVCCSMILINEKG